MSVIPSDIVVYGSANMPEADSATVGGSVDFTKRIDFSDIAANGFMDVVSSSASDTASKITYTGRDATGVVQSVTATLNGQTPVTGSQTIERLMSAAITGGAIGAVTNPGGTTAVGDILLFAHTAIVSAHTCQVGSANKTGTTPALVKLQSGDGAARAVGEIIRTKTGTGANQIRKIIAVTGYGTDIVAVNRDWGTLPDATTTYDIVDGMLFEILPNPVLAITRAFATAAADVPGGSTRTYYEKGFVVNNNTATALTAAGIQVASESPSLPGSALLDAGLDTAFNASTSSANRQTAPSGPTFMTQPANLTPPSGGNLPSGAASNAAGAIGLWLRLTVPAGTAPYKGAATIQATGNTV